MADVDNLKIRLKWRENEFEAEGPEGLIRSHLNEFKEMVGGRRPAAAPAGTAGTEQGAASILFQADKASQALSLRVLPSTDKGVLKQTSNTLLLVLHGFQEELALEQVPVLAAAQAIRQSGMVQVRRLSNAFLALQSDGLAMKIGSGKGTRYQLTTKGRAAAQNLCQLTLERAGLS